jgi:hypothetical protein
MVLRAGSYIVAALICQLVPTVAMAEGQDESRKEILVRVPFGWAPSLVKRFGPDNEWTVRLDPSATLFAPIS